MHDNLIIKTTIIVVLKEEAENCAGASDMHGVCHAPCHRSPIHTWLLH
jgi:hypothetical protein